MPWRRNPPDGGEDGDRNAGKVSIGDAGIDGFRAGGARLLTNSVPNRLRRGFNFEIMTALID